MREVLKKALVAAIIAAVTVIIREYPKLREREEELAAAEAERDVERVR